MPKRSEIPNVIRTGPPSERAADSRLQTDVQTARDRLDTLRRKYVAAIKMIMIAGIAEACDFLGEYRNYANTAGVFGECGDGAICDETAFSKNPIKAWAELFIALVTVAGMFPGSGIRTERIRSDSIDYDGNSVIGDYFLTTFAMTTEAYDWKDHFVEILLPCDASKSLTVVAIDREAVFVF